MSRARGPHHVGSSDLLDVPEVLHVGHDPGFSHHLHEVLPKAIALHAARTLDFE
ncbi:MAG: hypothetical protein R6X27_11190 [Candidatus Desulfacyla sp.]